jgi:uncharacterized protein YgiM (DUF1202 family)
MKKSLFFFSILFFFAIVAFAQDQKPDLYVIAKSGLKLREAASLTATPIQTVASGEKVKWISTDYKKPVTVEGIKGYMAKVSYEGKTGYMFDGFLAVNTPANPLIINQKTVVIKAEDKMELEEMVGTTSEGDLNEIASDIGYYRMMATDALEKYHIPYISSDMRFIQFVKEDGTKELVDTYQTREMDCYLFNGKSIKKMNTIDFGATEENPIPEGIKFMK